MPGLKIKGAVLDMDGLMFDTERLTFEIERELLSRRGVDFTLELYRENIGRRSVEVRKSFLKLCGDDFNYDEYHRRAMESFWAYTASKGVPLKDGLFDLLDFLRDNNIKIALATSTTSKSAREILRRAGVIEYFDRLICGDMVSRGKPDPEVFAVAAGRLKLSARECVALEDSPNGIASAYSAGLVTIMVPDLIEPSCETRKMCRRICRSLTEAQSFIGTMI